MTDDCRLHLQIIQQRIDTRGKKIWDIQPDEDMSIDKEGVG